MYKIKSYSLFPGVPSLTKMPVSVTVHLQPELSLYLRLIYLKRYNISSFSTRLCCSLSECSHDSWCILSFKILYTPNRLLKITKAYEEYYLFNVLKKISRKIWNTLLRSVVEIQEAPTSCFWFSAEKLFCLVAAQQLGPAISSQRNGFLEGNCTTPPSKQKNGTWSPRKSQHICNSCHTSWCQRCLQQGSYSAGFILTSSVS